MSNNFKNGLKNFGRVDRSLLSTSPFFLCSFLSSLRPFPTARSKLTGDGAGGAVEVLSSELARRRRSVVQRGFHFSREAERKILGKRSDAANRMPAYCMRVQSFVSYWPRAGGVLKGLRRFLGFKKTPGKKNLSATSAQTRTKKPKKEDQFQIPSP